MKADAVEANQHGPGEPVPEQPREPKASKAGQKNQDVPAKPDRTKSKKKTSRSQSKSPNKKAEVYQQSNILEQLNKIHESVQTSIEMNGGETVKEPAKGSKNQPKTVLGKRKRNGAVVETP